MYFANQLQRGLQAPLHFWAAAQHAVWSHPALPETPFTRTLVAMSELMERCTRVYAKPSFGLTATRLGERTVPVVERRVPRTPFCELVHFEREGAARSPKVLLVAPLSGHHATLLRETVRELLSDHDIYLTDWVDARLVPLSAGPFDLEDYVSLVLGLLRELGPDVHVISVCQPAVAVLTAVSLLAEDEPGSQPRTLALLAGPVDSRVNPTEVNRLARAQPLDWFERWAVDTVPATEPGAGRRVCRASSNFLVSSR